MRHAWHVLSEGVHKPGGLSASEPLPCSRTSQCREHPRTRRREALHIWQARQAERRHTHRCRATAGSGDAKRLHRAASQYIRGLEAGMEEDDIVAQELGATTAAELSDVQQRYMDQIKAKIAQQAAEEQARREARSVDFRRGKLLYEKGHYPQATVFFTRALDGEGPFSSLGGEIQLWLALSYQAEGREAECIELYKDLEKTHPVPAIRRQAANLRYILEAPKLRIGEDERVKLPVLTTTSRFAPKKDFARSRAPQSKGEVRKYQKTLEEKFLDEYRPPNLLPNRYVRVAAGVLAVALACYSASLS